MGHSPMPISKKKHATNRATPTFPVRLMEDEALLKRVESNGKAGIAMMEAKATPTLKMRELGPIPSSLMYMYQMEKPVLATGSRENGLGSQ